MATIPAQVPTIFENASSLTSSVGMNANFDYLVSYINSNCSDLAATGKFSGLPSGPATDPSGTTKLGNKAFADKRGVWRTANEQTKATTWAFTPTQQTVATFSRIPPVASRPITFLILLSGYINVGPQAGKWVGLLDVSFTPSGSIPTVRFAGSGNAAGSYREFNYTYMVTLTPSGVTPITFTFKATAFSGVSAVQQGTINCNVIIQSFANDLTTVT